MTPPTERRYLWMFAILAVVGFAADQASKYIVFAKLYPDHPMRQTTSVDVIPNWFALQTHYMADDDPGDDPLAFLRTISGQRLPFVNQGALFGVGAGWNKVFMAISFAAAIFIVFWVQRPNVATDRFLTFALGLILAGTLGNLYDRIVFGGVRDFLHCYYIDVDGGKHIWPDFNVADCCLVCGAGALLLHSFFVKDPTAEPAKTETAIVAAGTPAQQATPTGGA
jgi:signal peptidase II